MLAADVVVIEGHGLVYCGLMERREVWLEFGWRRAFARRARCFRLEFEPLTQAYNIHAEPTEDGAADPLSFIKDAPKEMVHSRLRISPSSRFLV